MKFDLFLKITLMSCLFGSFLEVSSPYIYDVILELIVFIFSLGFLVNEGCNFE